MTFGQLPAQFSAKFLIECHSDLRAEIRLPRSLWTLGNAYAGLIYNLVISSRDCRMGSWIRWKATVNGQGHSQKRSAIKKRVGIELDLACGSHVVLETATQGYARAYG